MLDKAVRVGQFVHHFQRAGYPIGLTPHAIIHTQNKSCVRYFAPTGDAKFTPLFISMPLINKWTVFDLMPGRSVIEKLVAAGIPVYLMDWGIPADEDAEVGMSELLDRVLHRAIARSRRHALQHHDTDQLDALGYCVGGTFLAAYVGLYPDAFRRVSFLAAPIDFEHAGRLRTWADPETFPVDDIVNGYGNFPAQMMADSFTWLKPGNANAKWRSLWERFDQPGFQDTWQAVEQWNSDAIPFWGEAYRSYIKHGYFANGLIHGTWQIGSRCADLGAVTAPVLVLAADRDHICPPDAAFGIEKAWGGEVKTHLLKGGHVGVCLGNSLPKALIAWAEEGR